MRARAGVVLLVMVAACAGRTAPPSPPSSPPVIVPVLAAVAAPVAPPPTPPPPDPCVPLKAGEVSEDETPSIVGTTGRTNAGAWLEARGVSKAAFRAWVKARDPRNLDEFDADSLFDGEDSCLTMTVGDKAEDALVCTFAVRTSIMRYSAVALVVRNRRITVVLDAGYALPAMDWPDARWLDLQVTFAAGGLEVDVHDRAEEGAVLVSAPSACRENFARYLACEQALRDGTPLDDVCPLTMDATGKTSFGHHSLAPPPSPVDADRVELHGCASALPKLAELVRTSAPGDMFLAEFRADRAFAVRSCNARGHYVWKGGRFVRRR